MAEIELNLDASLLSTRLMKKTAVSVRRNLTKTLPDDSNTSESLSVSVLVQDKGNHEEEEEDDDDVFSDALDTLSLKHRISDVSEAMTQDPQPLDFMLNRFLPAAKSMTVEQQPQYVLKRQPLTVMSEPMRQIRDIVPAEYRATPKRYESITSPSYFQCIDDEESEDDDEVSEYLSKRGCGMMSPQLCFKNSLSVLSSVRTSSHDQVKSSKVAQLKSRFQSVKKLALDSIHKHKSGSRTQSPIHPKFNIIGSEPLGSNMSTTSRPSSPYRHTSCMSPYRTVGNISPLHPSGFPGTRKEAEIMRANRLNKHIRNNNNKNSQDLLYPKSTRLDSSTSSVMEKTLYVDTEKCPKTSNNNGNSNIKILPVETVSAEPNANLELQDVEKNNSDCVLSPLAPPPPRKPSDSWLLRNLSSVRSKIPSRRYLFHPPKKNLEENSTSVTKWETIVKTSCIHRDHMRYSEELVARSSCQSKT